MVDIGQIRMMYYRIYGIMEVGGRGGREGWEGGRWEGSEDT